MNLFTHTYSEYKVDPVPSVTVDKVFIGYMVYGWGGKKWFLTLDQALADVSRRDEELDLKYGYLFPPEAADHTEI